MLNLEIPPVMQTALEKAHNIREERHASQERLEGDDYFAASEQFEKQRVALINEMTKEQQAQVHLVGETLQRLIGEYKQSLEDLNAKLSLVQDICKHDFWDDQGCGCCGQQSSPFD